MTSVSNLSWRIAVWSTRIGVAGIFNFNWFNDKRWLSTRCKGISNISLYADTVGNMIDHLTLGIDSTICSWTWVNTMQVSWETLVFLESFYLAVYSECSLQAAVVVSAWLSAQCRSFAVSLPFAFLDPTVFCGHH